jgi:hypothetical protein
MKSQEMNCMIMSTMYLNNTESTFQTLKELLQINNKKVAQYKIGQLTRFYFSIQMAHKVKGALSTCLTRIESWVQTPIPPKRALIIVSKHGNAN